MFLPPIPTGIELVACAASDSSTGAAAATSAHTTTLANPNSSDFAWQRGYSWYPDTPGQYPASKWDYYYSSGGLYDQAHTSSHAAHTNSLVADDFVWTRGYGWYTDTPGQYPDSKWAWYYDHGGLYDQAHTTATLQVDVQGDASQSHTTTTLANPNSSDFVWQRGYGWYHDSPGQYPSSKWDWYYSSGGTYDQAHQLGVVAKTEVEGASEAEGEGKPKAHASSPGHLLLCGHALLLGAVEATANLVQSGKMESWTADLKHTAKQAATAASPVGGAIMRGHILKENTSV